MSPQEFFRKVVPEGIAVLARPFPNGGFKHYVFDRDLDAAARQARALDAERHECYFALGALRAASYTDPSGKVRTRPVENIRALKSFFADLDVDPARPTRYASQEEALQALKTFCSAHSFPSPLLVSSGGGLHAYWPLAAEVPTEAWRPTAARFKHLLLAAGVKIDPARTADAASVLRVPGTSNYKQDRPRPVALIRDAGPYHLDAFCACLDAAQERYGTPPMLPLPAGPIDALGSNTRPAHWEPALFEPIALGCAQVDHLIRTGGEFEPVWYAGLQLVRHTTDPLAAAERISRAYPHFDPGAMRVKLAQLEAKGIGPTTCDHFRSANPGGCDACAHHGKLTSPIQLGGHVREAPPPVVAVENEQGEPVVLELPNPPYPYARRAGGGIVLRLNDEDGHELKPTVVYAYDMYPLRRLYSERHEVESTVWRIDLPLVGWTEIAIEQSVLADSRALHGILLSKGVYVGPEQIKLVLHFMVAYIAELQKAVKTERLFSRLGWRDECQTFVLGEKSYHADGRAESHRLSLELQQELPGLREAGALEGWREAIGFYRGAGYAAYRFLLYGAFGAPLFHMTGYHGAVVNAAGAPGAGKSTVLMAINSVWGHPERLMVNGTKGGTTVNSLYTLLGLHNNLPLCLDEVTRIEPGALGEFMLNVSQGQGKRRLDRAGRLRRAVETWSTIVITSANTDMYLTLGADKRDAAAETVRAFQVPFHAPHTHTKDQGDAFKRALVENHGHAGHVFAAYVASHYDEVRALVLGTVKLIDAKARVTSAERFWSAIVAAHIAGALIARKLGLLPDYPVEQDAMWAARQIRQIRDNLQEHTLNSKELLSEFLESRVGETLVISRYAQGGNLAPRVDQTPRGELSVRHERSLGEIYVLRTAFKNYCQEMRASFTGIQEALEAEGVLVDRDCRRVLGAGTDLAKGQVRCWKINVQKLEA